MQLVLGYGQVWPANVCVILVQIHRAFAPRMRDEKVPAIYDDVVVVVEEMNKRKIITQICKILTYIFNRRKRVCEEINETYSLHSGFWLQLPAPPDKNSTTTALNFLSNEASGG